MTERIDPFEALEPLSRRLLHDVLGGRDVATFGRTRNPRLLGALDALLRLPAPERPAAVLKAGVLREMPELAPHVALLERCAGRLVDVLEGRALASDVLFPDGAMDVVEPVYRGNRWSDHFNDLTARATVRAVEAARAHEPERVIRILEIGAGTGGTSMAVLAALDPHAGHVAYDYTDISPGFVQHGRRVHGGGRPFVQGRLLDIERPPAEQGFALGAYDVVLGTNVLHATADIGRSVTHVNALLRRGGLFFLNELTRSGAFATMTFGLLDGWWAYRDDGRRLPDSPIVSPDGWRSALGEAGFHPPALFGWTDPPELSFQCLFVAAKLAEAGMAASVRIEAETRIETPPHVAETAATADIRRLLAERLGALLGLETHELAFDRPLGEFGVDSIVVPQYVAALNREFGSTLIPNDIFNAVSLDGLAARLGAMGIGPPAIANDETTAETVRGASADVAVIGLACRFPDAPDADSFWRNLVNGQSAITEVPPERWNGRADGKVRWGAFLGDHDCFDPEFFNLSWREAEAMSPQQRLFVEQAWNALENAGYGRRSLAGRRCGVFVGAAPDGYGIHDNDSLSSLGGSLAILAARISYLLDLKGPSVPLDTACSSSLVAVHLACQSILAGDCDMALAGGVSILMTDGRLHTFLDDAGMLSPTGQCHTFDAAADGFVPGEGVGIVVLKRLDAALADRDSILGVIRASGINQDGRSSGITAPNGPAQTALERLVHERAGVDASAIGMVEAHGTGTQLGDPIEVAALADTFRLSTDRTGFCALGSVKTNIGHTLTAAGIAGLIKALLAIRHGVIPPSLNYAEANPQIDFARSPFFVPRQPTPWPDGPRVAAVSSFGFSGTNGHAVLGEAPPLPLEASDANGPALVLLSARTEEGLDARKADLLAWLEANEPRLGDLAFTLSHGRTHFEHRAAILVDSVADLRRWHGRSWRSEPLMLPSQAGHDARLGSLLAAATPDLVRIAECYVAGGDGDWSRLAAPDARRLPLPGYRFARRRFRVRPAAPVTGAAAAGAGEVERSIALDPAQSWLGDHRFAGQAVMPATACLELVRPVATEALGRDVARFASIRFERPMSAMPDAACRVHVRRVADDRSVFRITGAADVLHVTGEAGGASADRPRPFADLSALTATLSHRFAPDEVYARFEGLGFSYGPRFRVIRSLRADATSAVAELAPAMPADAGVQCDIALLDGAIQAAIGLMLARGETLGTVVPVGIETADLFEPITEPCVAHVALVSAESSRWRLRVAIYDLRGHARAVLDGLEIQVSTASDATARDGVHTYAPAWHPAPLDPAPTPSDLLLFDSDETLWRSLGDRAILVRPGSAFCRLDTRSFALDPASEDDYERLCATLQDEGILPRAIWHLWSRRRGFDDGMDDVEPVLRAGLHAVVHLSKALARRSPLEPFALLHVHAARDEAPLQATVAGFGAALLRENPLLRLMSVATAADDPAALIASLAAETHDLHRAAPVPHHRASRWDGQARRSLWRLEPVSVRDEPASGGGLRPGATVLLTGALGGVGRHVARHLAARHGAKLLLVGRSAPGPASDALIASIHAAGGDAHYLAADINDPAQAAQAAALARVRFGALHAVVHAAGVTHDRFLLHKDPVEMRAVLAPKLAGTLALHRATIDDPLDLFVCFSSLAGTFGNAGQTDYSAANRFLDAFVAGRSGPGRSLSIGWPFWRDGGLSVESSELERRAAATGIRVLGTEEGLAALDRLMAGASGHVLVLPGDAEAIRVTAEGIGAAPQAPPMPVPMAEARTSAVDEALAYLRGLVAEATSMPEDRIHPDRALEHYGLDSLLVTRLNARIEHRLPGLPKTLFFEHATLRGVAEHVAGIHPAVFAPPAPKPEATVDAAPRPPQRQESPHAEAGADDAIAIIGIAGRFPGADSLAALWDNLRADRDLITEVPAERWDAQAWFDDRPGTPGRSYIKWGGFLDGVDRFDPLFFNIAPGEAAGIDPNERLFLEVCWEALENAGHTRASLAPDPARAVGVYAGVMYGEYQLLAAAAQSAGQGAVGGSSPYWSVANRVSYHLDLHGPSLTVDSACSSSLTAIHLACQALASGECSAAIAGGVNLNLHPLKYVGLSQGRFAATDGRCHSFTAGGDGYVPGEGVGAVILKPLAKALADGDYVHAVIRGWAANHGGKTNGYTVPNPNAQGEAIAAALRRGGIAPETVSYVEAHGTGTALGDPIEVAGLAAAFGDGVPRQSCALGSIKANLGHLEAAAGIAGLTRVVLQLQHRTLTPTRRHGPPNPNIDFAATPFRLQDRTESWSAPGPLRAGVSSFGAGGANAHVVLEEFRPVRPRHGEGEPALLVLSSRTEAQLKAYASRMAAFLRGTTFGFADVCRTLQIGREPMAARLALVTGDPALAAEQLDAFADGRPTTVMFALVDEERMASDGPLGAELEGLARAWLEGADVPWREVDLPGAVVPVPAQPLMRRRYWLDRLQGRGASVTLHPFLDHVAPSLDDAVFVKRFDPDSALLRDHTVQGRAIVPGVVQLEMARAALAATGCPAAAMQDIVWSRPLEVGPDGAEVTVRLSRAEQGVAFEITLEGGNVVCQGRASAPSQGRDQQTPRHDIEALRRSASRHRASDAIYAELARLGLDYGPSLRALTDVWSGGEVMLAALRPPASSDAAVAFPPAVLDGALQSLLGLASGEVAELFVPFALDALGHHGDLANAAFVVARRRSATGGVASFDLSICDAAGVALLTFTGLAARPKVSVENRIEADLPLAVRRTVWRVAPAGPGAPSDGRVVVAYGEGDGDSAERLAKAFAASATCVPQTGTSALVQAVETATDLVWLAAPASPDKTGVAETMALDLLHAIRGLDGAGRLTRELRLHVITRDFQSIAATERPDPHAGALVGIAKCLPLEFPRIAVSFSDVDEPAFEEPGLLERVLGEPCVLPVREVAWRGGVRHVLAAEPFVLPEARPPLAHGAVVLIVGGAGGIGRELAGWLARTCSARVALVGRRPESAVAAEVARIDPGMGAVRYFQADATDRDAMTEVVRELRALWGGIDAAVHAALVLQDRTLSRMDDATFKAALAPKLAGSRVLAEVLAGERLQLLAFLSSVNVLSGSRGQANYVAGSSFADAFARHLAATSPWRVVVTNWGLWGDVGVVSDASYRERLARQGVHPIGPSEGIAAFAAVLNGKADRVAIVRAEPDVLRQLGLDPMAAEDPPSGVGRTARDTAASFTILERWGRVRLAGILRDMAGQGTAKAWTTEGLRRHLGIAQRHALLFPALLDALARDGLLASADGLWRFTTGSARDLDAAQADLDAAVREAAWLAGPRDLLRTCLESYAGLLRGSIEPVEVLFPQGSMATVTKAYAGNPIADRFNAEMADIVKAEAERAPPGRPLRVIELGAGTGSTTAAVLDALDAVGQRVDYLATDVSQHFVSHGETRFAGRSDVRFALYDAEREPESNGVAAGGFDLVLAANVLHATADLAASLARVRRLLRPGGRLLLSEATRAQDFGTFVFGLTPGWWLATDRERRIPFSPLATVGTWRDLLGMAGFADADADVRTGEAPATEAPHALLVARNTAVHETVAVAVAADARPSVAAHEPAPVAPARRGERLQRHVRAILADVLKLEPDEVRLHESFDRYGLESLTALEIRNRLDRDIPGLPATLLFEHNTLARLAAWLEETHGEAVARLLPESSRPASGPDVAAPAAATRMTPDGAATASVPVAGARPASIQSADEPIAIIGFSGRYPGGADADAFWRLLLAGESAIGEVPDGRWDAGPTFDADGGEGRSYTKWAGFIDDVDRFDPLFFNIAPLDAEIMDPQERVFLETAWATLEQAGYTPSSLRARAAAHCPEQGDVGVFVGAMNMPYQWIAAEAWAAGHASAASTGYWSIANRVSYLMDFSGLSLAVDTACSASLTAIHLACESLRRGECGAALAGGVNLILHPRQFVNLSQARMVSRGDECRAFGAGADGFVDGEGAGAVLLKPLSAAERDGDRIEAVILGSAVNAGGRTSSFTVPSPKAQARVIRSAIRRAGVAPETVGYVEAHGTGTALGDPIEISGLAEALDAPDRPPCAIGALKANIGHLESAAGVAGLTKVLLQMRHRTIAPSRHARTPNPLIDFGATSFVLPPEPMPWLPAGPDGRLRAGVSSFGAGGANAHVVLEDYAMPDGDERPAPGPDLVVLSAQDPDRLLAVVQGIIGALADPAMRLDDVAHTLRVGRAGMAARLALLADDRAGLIAKLEAWRDGHPMPGTFVRPAESGRTGQLLAETEEGQALLRALLARRDLARLGQIWVEGADIDWTALPPDGTPRRVVLPTYPFRRERYWLPSGDARRPGVTDGVASRTTGTPSAATPGDRTATHASEEAATDTATATATALAPPESALRIELFARSWQPVSLTRRRRPPLVAVLSRDADFPAELASAGARDVVRVVPGDGFEIIDPLTCRMDPFSESDHAALVAHLGAIAPDGYAVVQALDWERARSTTDSDGARVSILLTQAAQRDATGDVRVLHLFAGADDRPLDQAVGSLARSASQENSTSRLRAIGLSGGRSGADAAAIACQELEAADDAPEVMYDGDRRTAPSIDRAVPAAQASTIGFRIGGAYLLVGGLGEVGCAIAERLTREYRARIAIIGRSAPRGPALERLRQLEAAGIQVHYEVCDLTDRDALTHALGRIRAEIGRLHGILHLARAVEDALLVRKSASSVARVMAAKVEGSIMLDEALADEELDWFVLCSSLAAWLGLAGGGDYALACAFQSGFARLRQQRVDAGERQGRTVAICWPQWDYDRYLDAAKRRRLTAEGLQTIDARDGLRIITQALQSDHAEVAAIKGDENAFRKLTRAYFADAVPSLRDRQEDIAAELADLTDDELAAYVAHLRNGAARPDPSPPEATDDGTSGEPPGEALIVDVICALLKLPPERFDGRSEFAAFGMDSIKALHAAERLQKRLGIPVDPAMFYEFPTVGALAQAVAGRAAMPAEAQR
ncbi:SDR family NAD(P)-dependent oxidoreductase [Marinivivus vitaminiproducens]|uniref:SDR family NAD(P)-dependent oxidoreductase n=1 Tax=Marinivivus vitaminiproducens TaxID=3035935 RepID=UPI00279B508A|nr:SDR family NAD(P)-dependent oxidoreductase [Geminicoccaceae bacterium SCSIO 64248]